jgi:hypothetical protein
MPCQFLPPWSDMPCQFLPPWSDDSNNIWVMCTSYEGPHCAVFFAVSYYFKPLRSKY